MEIVRWARGEDVFSDFSGQESRRSFSIIFNAGKNQVAHSPEQLADFMRQDQSLAIKYLYTGKLTKWLTDNQRPELATEIEDIVENAIRKIRQPDCMRRVICSMWICLIMISKAVRGLLPKK